MAALRLLVSARSRIHIFRSSGFAEASPPLRRSPSASSGFAEAASSYRFLSVGPPLSQGSSPGPEEGEGLIKRQDLSYIFRALRRYTLVKAVLAFVGGAGVLLFSSEVYSVYRACQGDVPMREQNDFWVPASIFDGHALMDKAPEGLFFFVTGLPGIGKTSQICQAARGGAVIYVDGAAKRSFSGIKEDVNQRYPRLRLNMIAWLLRRDQSGLEVLGSLSRWVKRLRGMHLIFIVDHVDKLEPADALELASWAKTAADERKFRVILVGSEQSSNILGSNDARTRCELVECYPPSAQKIRHALTDYLSTHPKNSTVDVERMLYLLGPVPSFYIRAIGKTTEDIFELFIAMHLKAEMKGRDFNDEEFWYSLLIAGSDGIQLKVHDTNKVLSDPCILYYKRRIYFVSGCSRDLHAQKLLDKYREEVKKTAARTKIAGQCSFKDESRELIERIAKIEEVMRNQTYEAYGPLIGHNA